MPCMETRRKRVRAISLREAYFLFLCAAVIAGFALFPDAREPVASAETRFVEHSTSGLQIVPASCPSNPHSAGECSTTCTLSASPSTISPGQSTTLSWDTPPGSTAGFVIINNGVGRQPASGRPLHVAGSVTVSPSQTITYQADRYVYGPIFFGFGGDQLVGSCSATVTVAAPPPPPPSCPAGQTWNGTECVCPAGQTWNGSQCVTGGSGPSCPTGSTCVPPGSGNSCPIGYTLQGSLCVLTGCPTGFTLQGGQCLPDAAPQCSGFFCQGSQLRQRVDQGGQCTSVVVQNCAFGCSGGGCLAAPSGEGNITVTPSLIRNAERTTVTWTTSDMVPGSCTVTENNPEVSDSGTGPSGSFVSGQLRQQTRYTLQCTRQDDTVFIDTATVNIIPVFQEQ